MTGISYVDISKSLGVSEGTVKSRLSRERQSLADKLRKHGIYPEGTCPDGTFAPRSRHISEKEVGTRD
jgi:uncharacterized protein YidB (DUF937 family)